MIEKYLYLLFISMVPLVELRLAVPISQAMDLPILPSLFVCMIGNMIPVPFIYLFARKILIWGTHRRWIYRPCRFFLEKGERAGQKLTAKSKYGMYVALLLFVGIPIPGTGAWTGTLAASILDLDFKKTVLCTTTGILMAGIIMMIVSNLGLSLFGL